MDGSGVNCLGVTSENRLQMRGHLFRSSRPLSISYMQLCASKLLVSLVLMRCLHCTLGNYDAYFLTQPFMHVKNWGSTRVCIRPFSKLLQLLFSTCKVNRVLFQSSISPLKRVGMSKTSTSKSPVAYMQLDP